MIRALVALVVLGLASCTFDSPSTNQQSAAAKFAVACVRFAEVVDDLILQRRAGAINDDAYRSLTPYLETGESICKNDAIVDYGQAEGQIEAILASVAEAQR